MTYSSCSVAQSGVGDTACSASPAPTGLILNLSDGKPHPGVNTPQHMQKGTQPQTYRTEQWQFAQWIVGLLQVPGVITVDARVHTGTGCGCCCYCFRYIFG